MIDRRRRRFTFAPLLAAGLSALPQRLLAQGDDYPTRQIGYLVPFPAGGLSDILARLIGDGIRRHYQQTVVVEAKPGAAGTIAVEALKRTPADGYTLLAVNNGFFSVSPFLFKLSWDPMQDLVPVAMTGDAYMPMFVHPSVPAGNLKEFVAYAKANPDKLNYGSAGLGTLGHLSGEYLQKRADIKLTHVPYKGSPAALQAVLANDTQIFFGPEGADSALAGKLRAIALLGPKRWAKLPNVQTTDEQGVPNWALRSWHGVVVRSGTPAPVMARINTIFNQIMSEPPVIERIQQQGLEPAPTSLAELNERVRTDRANFGGLIRDLAIKSGEP